ncbi:HAD hydrolase-like protein [Lactobacillus sp. CC-MHH1034]|uniref:HAD hydrolase-like protein n=1 Tax=Agrilactobacillus fermenti TaxID=2586909 RepID=UPI001E39ED9B|nr:HAD hydrolase-like protein [Agrilactobacillus fermenti]MCD2256163.1 HAD hydrolase-like protein [Agrilactobacillus fermenti]
MTKTVFFDLDGTLTDSKKGILNGLKYSFKAMNVPTPDDKTLQLFIGPPLNQTVQKYSEIQDPDQVQAFMAHFHDYYGETGWQENAVFPGIMPMLADLKAAGYDLAIATAKPEMFAKKISTRFGFDQYMTGLFAATDDEMTRTQKDEILAYGLARMPEKQLANIVMVGDRANDIAGGLVNRVHAVGVLYGFGAKAELVQAGAEVLADSVTDLHRKLLDWQV